MNTQAGLYRELPSVDELLREPGIGDLVAHDGQAAVTDACRIVLGNIRAEIAAGHLDSSRLAIALSGIEAAIQHELRRALGYSLRPVINATGVILHTNLGRAPIAHSVFEHIRETSASYSNLELDLESGTRGKRDAHVNRLFKKLLSETVSACGRTDRQECPFPHGQCKNPSPPLSSTTTPRPYCSR